MRPKWDLATNTVSGTPQTAESKKAELELHEHQVYELCQKWFKGKAWQAQGGRVDGHHCRQRAAERVCDIRLGNAPRAAQATSCMAWYSNLYNTIVPLRRSTLVFSAGSRYFKAETKSIDSI